MQILQNVISPPPQSDAALSQDRQELPHEFAQTEADALQEMHDRPHIRQQRRGPHCRLIQGDAFQTQFALRRPRLWRNYVGRWRWGSRGWRPSGNRRRPEDENLRQRAAAGRAARLPPSIVLSFLLPAHLRPIVGQTPFTRPLPTKMLAAAERTTQVLPARIPGMSQKADSAADAGNHATLQFRMRLDRRG